MFEYLFIAILLIWVALIYSRYKFLTEKAKVKLSAKFDVENNKLDLNLIIPDTLCLKNLSIHSFRNKDWKFSIPTELNEYFTFTPFDEALYYINELHDDSMKGGTYCLISFKPTLKYTNHPEIWRHKVYEFILYWAYKVTISDFLWTSYKYCAVSKERSNITGELK
jgi:hypothetical protein